MDVMDLRRGLLMNQKSGIPTAYQRVAYIEATGTQYIITDIPVQSPVRIDADVMFTNTGDYALVCTGYRQTSSTPQVRIGMGRYGDTVQNFYRTYYIANSAKLLTNTRYIDSFYGEEGLQKAWIDSVEVSATTYSTDSEYLPIDSTKIAFYIFAEGRNTAGTITAINQSKARLYGLKMTNGTNLLGDFIPCIRRNDSEPGLYDTVSRNFYTNDGTGEFVVPI